MKAEENPDVLLMVKFLSILLLFMPSLIRPSHPDAYRLIMRR
jgi:hypothetical protein